MGRLEGRVALVTGAAGQGIGRATALRLLEEGAAVVLTDSHERRTEQVGSTLLASTGGTLLALPLDVADRAQVDEVLKRVEGELGTVDILVNNAAVNMLGLVHEMAPADWDRTLAVDLTGAWYLLRAVIPGMMATGRGSIVNVSSVAAWLGGGGEGPYAAAKAGLQSLTRTVAHECGRYGIRCNAVAPGIIESRFVDQHRAALTAELARTPLARFGKPEEVAAVVAFLASDDASYVTGEVLTVSGGMYMRA